jgi:hypothetical protein
MYDDARREIQTEWKQKLLVELGLGAIVALVTSTTIHICYSPVSIHIRILCFAFFFPQETYNFIKSFIFTPLFTARYFATPGESDSFFRGGALFAAYTATLLGIRLFWLAVKLIGVLYFSIGSKSAIVMIATLVVAYFFGPRASNHVYVQGPGWVTSGIKTYYLSLMRVDNVHYWLCELSITQLSVAVIRELIRMCTWSVNPRKLATFDFTNNEINHQLAIQQGQFRLLHIRRRTPFLEIHADLQRFTMGESPPYECIPYCWGKPELMHSSLCTVRPGQKVTEKIVNCCKAQKITPSTKTIVLNGYKHEVIKNVYDILLRRSSLLRDTTIWIDSLCINQKDKIEKNLQVPMMKTIYQMRHTYLSVLAKTEMHGWQWQCSMILF